MLIKIRKIITLTTFTCLLFLVGCDAVKSAVGIQQSKVWLEKVHFRAAENANNTSPVKIHIVIAYKEALAAEIGKLTAADYFKKADRLKADAGTDLDVFSTDVLAGSTKVLDITPSQSSGFVALMFARYESPGDHRTNVSADYEIQVDLAKNDLKVTPIKKG